MYAAEGYTSIKAKDIFIGMNDQTTIIGAIACWGFSTDSGDGHAAVVEKIEGDRITVSEAGMDTDFHLSVMKKMEYVLMDGILQMILHSGGICTCSSTVIESKFLKRLDKNTKM